MDNSKEGLMYLNKKLSLSSSFEPISEKQEDMSLSSKQNNQSKTKNSVKNSKDNKITKGILDDVDIIKRSVTQNNKKSWIATNHKNFLPQIREENKNELFKNVFLKSFKTKRSKKNIFKKNSIKEQGLPISNIDLSQMNTSEMKYLNIFTKNNLARRGTNILNNINNPHSIQNSILTNQENSFSRQYSNAKSISNDYFEMQYLNKKDKKKTTLHKGSLNFTKKNETSVFDQIKNSELYGKSEQLLFKLKICHAILSIFSLLSIILNCSDAIIYNGNSLDYLHKKNNFTYVNYKKNIETYYYINDRKISSKENNIRIFNGIVSLFCSIIIIIIHLIKTGAIGNKKKNSKKERLKKMLNQFYNMQRKKSLARNKIKQEEERTRNEKIKIIDLNSDKEVKDETSEIYDKSRIIAMCIINIIFYPPYINKAFIGKFNDIIYIYSLNSIFLIISLYKISNIYRSLFYLSSINNPFNKAICKSKLIMLNSSFMFKYHLQKSPLTFLLLNLIIVLISIGLVICCIEFFSFDLNENYWDNIIENKVENFINIFNAFFFFIIRNIHETHSIKSILGKLVMYIGGIIGMLFSSYLIYYINIKIEFSPEEQESYIKLTKLLDPINKEHKSSNLLKSLLILRKIIKDNLNTEKDYRLKMEEFKKPSNNQRRPIFPTENNFQFDLNSEGNSNNNLINMNEQNKNEEKKRFLKYLGNLFFLKVKLIIECKNYSDNLKIARNSSQSLNDVLKTLGNKMDMNITQLNNKIEVLIRNDQRFLDFIKFSGNTMKKIKKIKDYNKSLIQYFVEVHNEYVKQIIEIRKESEFNSLIINKNSGIFPKRMKSNIFGSLHFKSKNIQSKFLNDFNKKKKIIKDMHYFNFPSTIKKQRSSMITSIYLKNTILEDQTKLSNLKPNTHKSKNKQRQSRFNRGKKSNSLDDFNFINNGLKDKIKGRNSLAKKVGRSNSVLNREKKENA